MVAQKYRWDFIGLSTDQKPTPATSDKVVDGSTFYCSDNSKLYVFCKDTWYERKALGGGGGGGGTSYTAGTGIDITDDTISVDTETIQEKLTAGSNVTISDNTISATDTTYTAGSNVNISDQNVISATDTTYSNFTGTDGTAAGAAGLVPAPATTDAGKFLKADGTWDTAGGGSGPTVVQTTGTSTTDVMSQNAVSSMIFSDPGTDERVKIGSGASANFGDTTAIGKSSSASASSATAIGASSSARSNCTAIGSNSKAGTASAHGGGVAIGYNAQTSAAGAIAIGRDSSSTHQGEMNIGTSSTSYGYNSSNYRLLSGVYDGQDLHDAATVAQGNTLSSSAPTTSTVGVLGQLWTDTTNMHTYQCTAISGSTYTWTQRW